MRYMFALVVINYTEVFAKPYIAKALNKKDAIKEAQEENARNYPNAAVRHEFIGTISDEDLPIV